MAQGPAPVYYGSSGLGTGQPATPGSTPSSLTVSGARVAILNGTAKIGFATDCNYTIAHEHLPVFVLDQLEPVEYAETAYTVVGTVAGFRIPGYSPMATASNGNPLMPFITGILTQAELTLNLYDRIYGNYIGTLFRVKCYQRAGGIAARSLGQETLNFYAICFSDESQGGAFGTSTQGSIGDGNAPPTQNAPSASSISLAGGGG